MREPVRYGIVPVDAAPVGSYPENTFPVDVEGPDGIVAQARRVFRIVHVAGDTPGRRIEPRQTVAMRSYPHVVIGVLAERSDDVAAHGTPVPLTDGMPRKPSCIRIEAVHPSIPGAEPKTTCPVLYNGYNGVAADGGGIIRIVTVTREPSG